MILKLLTEHHLEFLSLKGGYRGSSESTLVKMSNCKLLEISCSGSYAFYLQVHRNKDMTISLKLADFGLAMDVKEQIYTVCGTPTYVAPEILSEIGIVIQ